MSFNVEKLVRKHLVSLTHPTSIAEQPESAKASILLNKNENSLGSPLIKWYNRYPDSSQWKVKQKLSEIKAVPPAQILLGNGCDECIDLLYRAFCEPGKDNAIVMAPTYSRYETIGRINNISIRQTPLLDNCQLNLAHIEQLVDAHTKIIWLCSPNNPTGNSLNQQDIEMVLNNFDGLVVIDEAYINFSKYKSFSSFLSDYPNLVIMQTLSKAWGLAGLRVGMLFSSNDIINILHKIKFPYNIGEDTQEMLLRALQNYTQVNDMVHLIVDMRKALAEVLMQMPFVQQVYESDTNFLLIKINNKKNIYNYLLKRHIATYNVSESMLYEDCLRITVGTEKENTQLVDALLEYLNEKTKEIF